MGSRDVLLVSSSCIAWHILHAGYSLDPAAGSAAKVETEAGHTPVARSTATEAFAAGQSTENSGACISPMPASEEQNQAEPSQEVKTEPKTRNTEGFERLLAGVQLASLEEGPILELPLIHPLTGIS